MRPMLACDYDPDQLRFPLIAQPKIDGVRALNITGQLTGRSLKKFKNKHVSALFSNMALFGLDGELAAESETHPDLCRLTTSAVGTIEGQPFVLWWLFDMVTPETRNMVYWDRLMYLRAHLNRVAINEPSLYSYLRLVTYSMVENMDDLLQLDEHLLAQGYEGTILRDPHGKHKEGRSTVREGGLLRIKRFLDAEAVVTAVTEGESNQNEATTGLLGQTERSSHMANMVPNGMVGNMLCRALATVTDGEGNTLIEEGQELTIAAGKLTADQRKYYWQNPNLILNQIIKFKFFPKGIKDKPRFPTFQSFRDEVDRS